MGKVYNSSITLVTVDDGKDGNSVSYYLSTNVEDINKIVEEDSYEFSPTQLKFKVFKNGEDNPLSLDSYIYKISVLTNGAEQIYEDLVMLLDSLPALVNDENENIIIKDRVFSFVGNEVICNLSELVSYTYTDVENENVQKYNSLVKSINEENTSFVITAYDKNNEKVILDQKVINCEYALPEELAKFTVTAKDIQAAVGQAGFAFSGDGLTITNGSFIIKDDDQNDILSYSDGQLTVKGTGSFSGQIEAESGTIGGFDITDNGIYSLAGSLPEEVVSFKADGAIYYEKSGDSYVPTQDEEIFANKARAGAYYKKVGENYEVLTKIEFDSSLLYYEDSEGNIKTSDKLADLTKTYYSKKSSVAILGREGKIIAENIDLGTGAKISNYIQLGDAYIYNPEVNDGKFLAVGEDIILNADDKTLQIGKDLILNGNDSTITGKNFEISPDLATFQNANINGKISTVVFEKGHVQSVGGAMIFKLAYKVTDWSVDNDIIKIAVDAPAEEISQLNGQYVVLVDTNGVATNKPFLVNVVDNKICVQGAEAKEYRSVIVIGVEEGIVIGINSETSESTFLKPEGLSISQLKKQENGTYKLNTNLLLGNLSSVGYDGYGLYSDNVHLRGSLTTENDGSYAGINTGSEVSFTKIDNDNSNIIIWSGAKGTDEKNIKNASFQVSRNGSIFANQARFENSVFANSKISASEIEAAVIRGLKDEEGHDGTLTIFDTAKGIIFKKDNEGVATFSANSGEETFRINSFGLGIGEDFNFINVNNGNITFNGNKGFFDSIEVQNQTIRQNEEEYSVVNSDRGMTINNIKGEGIISTYHLGEEEFDVTIGGNKLINLVSGNFNINTTNTNVKQKLLIGNEKNYMEYKRVTNGHDLYVYNDIQNKEEEVEG